jgi:hypothetical protein
MTFVNRKLTPRQIQLQLQQPTSKYVLNVRVQMCSLLVLFEKLLDLFK